MMRTISTKLALLLCILLPMSASATSHDIVELPLEHRGRMR